ncbi:hypothetical protein CYANOKiyG1_01560 [Okeania sp. KiyG1]|nr:hypothetical protein CYANOKiyG1_01560 [Okeania sp. KiyG1]
MNKPKTRDRNNNIDPNKSHLSNIIRDVFFSIFFITNLPCQYSKYLQSQVIKLREAQNKCGN